MRYTAFALLSILIVADCYVTYKTYIPQQRQRQWLTKLTGDICDSPTGSRLINRAPQVLKGWSVSKKVTAENAVAVESLVKRLVDESKAGTVGVTPTTAEYNVMLGLWVRSREGAFAAERCEQIVTTMQQLYSENGDASVQPDLESFKSVLSAWKNSGVDFNALRAQRVLEWMITLYKTGENDKCLPDAECFDIVLQMWSRNGDSNAAEKSEKLLILQEKLAQATEYKQLKPTTLSFNAVLSAWARKFSSDNNDYTRMCAVLGLMETLYFTEGNRRVEPDRCTYNIVLCALAKGFSPITSNKADMLLRTVESRYKAGELSWKPNVILFNAVIGSWAHSDSSGAYRKARSVLDRQLHLYEDYGCKECKPDVIGFTSVLASCASEPKRQEKTKAFHLALGTFQQLEKNVDLYGKPNHVTYGTMLKACARLLPHGSKERSRWTRRFFEKCVEDGMVGGMVLSRVREAATPSEYKQLMQGYSRNALPHSWTHNVRERTAYRKNPVNNNSNNNNNTSKLRP